MGSRMVLIGESLILEILSAGSSGNWFKLAKIDLPVGLKITGCQYDASVRGWHVRVEHDSFEMVDDHLNKIPWLEGSEGWPTNMIVAKTVNLSADDG